MKRVHQIQHIAKSNKFGCWIHVCAVIMLPELNNYSYSWSNIKMQVIHNYLRKQNNYRRQKNVATYMKTCTEMSPSLTELKIYYQCIKVNNH